MQRPPPHRNDQHDDAHQAGEIVPREVGVAAGDGGGPGALGGLERQPAPADQQREDRNGNNQPAAAPAARCGWRLVGIHGRTPAASSASTKANQSPPKNRWPLISPASSAPVSFIFCLMSECPVFHITGVSPARSSICGSTSEHFTSKITECCLPWRRARSRPNSTSRGAPTTTRPCASTAPIRAPCP